MAAKDPFQTLHAALRRDTRVTEMEMFGARGFKVSGKVFAIFWKGNLVLTMPELRARGLVAAEGSPLPQRSSAARSMAMIVSLGSSSARTIGWSIETSAF